MTVYDHVKSAMQRVTETTWWRVTWEQTPGDPGTPRALDNEELFVVEGSQTITWRNLPTVENSAKYKGLIEIMPKNLSETATEASTVHTSQRVHAVMAAIVGNTARGAISPANQ